MMLTDCEQLVIFDLDDTLVDTSDVYFRARAEFIGKLVHLKIEREIIVDLFEHVDTDHIQRLGLNPDRYLKTMEATYRQLAAQQGVSPEEDVLHSIQRCGEMIRTVLPEPIEGARELLAWAADHFVLALVTRGEEQLQRRKIDRLGFTRYFQCVKVVEGKDCAALLDVLASTDFENSKTWVVGDSIRSDINPGIEAGLRCILYHYRHDQYQWTQEYGAKAIGAFYLVERLDAVRSVLENPSAHRMVDQIGELV